MRLMDFLYLFFTLLLSFEYQLKYKAGISQASDTQQWIATFSFLQRKRCPKHTETTDEFVKSGFCPKWQKYSLPSLFFLTLIHTSDV